MKYFAIFEKNLREYFSCNERLETFLTCFCDILCYVGNNARTILTWNFHNYFLSKNTVLSVKCMHFSGTAPKTPLEMHRDMTQYSHTLDITNKIVSKNFTKFVLYFCFVRNALSQSLALCFQGRSSWATVSSHCIVSVCIMRMQSGAT